MKKILKDIGIYIGVFSSLIIIFILSLLLTSLIPSKYIENNVRKSSEILIKEGEREIIDLGYKYESLFHFTDALMINTAYSIDSNHPYYSFMMARKNYIPNQTLYEHEETKYHVGTSEKYKDELGNTFQTKELYGLMHGENIEDSYDYARYWHGYLAFLRPLLLIFNIQGIRIFFKVLITILILIMLILIVKKINLLTAIIYLLTFVALSILTVAESINEITTFIIAIISAIFILIKDGKFKRPGIVFMSIGAITSFSDLLTTPLITLGFTLPIYILLNLKEENKKLLLDFIKLSIFWALRFWINLGNKMDTSRYNFRKECYTKCNVTIFI